MTNPAPQPDGSVPADSLVGLINQLAEVPQPPPVPMVPQTLGWLVLALMCLAALGLWGLRLLRRHRANAYRRAALRALAAAGDDAAEISAILKRAAMVAYGRRRVAGLSGADWLAFLAETAPKAGFASRGAAFGSATYRCDPPPPDPALTELAQAWLRQHRPSADTGAQDD